MFGIFTTRQSSQPEPEPQADPLAIFGSTVRHAETGKVGILRHIGISPFWAEEQEGVIRAYVVSDEEGDKWGDYWLPEEVVFVD